MSDGGRSEIVRRWGMNRTHAAQVPPGIIQPARVFGADFEAVFEPLVALCGTVLNGAGSHAGAAKVIMRPGTPILCPACREIVRVDEVGSEQGEAGMTLVSLEDR